MEVEHDRSELRRADPQEPFTHEHEPASSESERYEPPGANPGHGPRGPKQGYEREHGCDHEHQRERGDVEIRKEQPIARCATADVRGDHHTGGKGCERACSVAFGMGVHC